MANPRARALRTEMTDAERALWRHIRRRQQPMGAYIVDFFCPEAKLVIEVDGGQHAEREKYDGARTAWLEARGYRVVRYWNTDVLGSIEGVLEDLRRHLAGL